MSGSKNRRQLVLTLTSDDDDLLRGMHEAKVAELQAKDGGSITISAYVMHLVKAGADKLGIKPTAIKKAAKRPTR